jgi:hypothetical protein
MPREQFLIHALSTAFKLGYIKAKCEGKDRADAVNMAQIAMNELQLAVLKPVEDSGAHFDKATASIRAIAKMLAD